MSNDSKPMEVITIDMGEGVICDFCNEDYTHRSDGGGLLFGSYAVCPKCAPELEENAIRECEDGRIRARCIPGMSFADWVRRVLRGATP